jgi:hypothetical protein
MDWDSLKRYPTHFAPFGLDLWSMPNEVTERRPFYSLMGVGGNDMEAIRRLAREWLQKQSPAEPANAASLRGLKDATPKPGKSREKQQSTALQIR